MTPTSTSCLTWSPELALNDARTDATHEEFISLLNATALSDASMQLAHYQNLVAHTVEHFAQEERWMLAIGLSAEHCHFSEHASVLEVMRVVQSKAEAGDLTLINKMLEALAQWFPQHAINLDGGLVNVMRELGFDTHTETMPARRAA